ncbi:MAG: PQQ-binding-like beta-propeller repeat protein [Planctomycetota bacterium]
MRKLTQAAILFALAGIALGEGKGWPLFQGDARRTGLTTGEGPDKWKKRWVVEGNFGNYDAPGFVVGTDGSVCTVVETNFSDGFALFSWDAAGKARWSCKLPDDSLAVPAFAPDGGVVVGLLDGTVIKVKADGTLAWATATKGPVSSSAAFAADGTVYIGSRDNSLYALDPMGGRRWNFATNGWVTAAPALAPDGTIYVASWDGRLYALTPEGKETWRAQTPRPITACPVVASDGTIYLAGQDGALRAFTPAGAEIWKVQTDGWLPFPPCLDPSGNILFSSNDSFLRSLSPKGEELWRLQVDQPNAAPVCDAKGRTYLLANDELLVVKPDGKVLWKRPGAQSEAIALGADGTLYLQGTRFLYAVHE